MTEHPAREIETVRKRLEAGERGGTPADRELLLEFSDRLHLLGEEYSNNRHIKLLRHLMRLSENVEADVRRGVLVDALEDRDAAEAAVRWIHTNYENHETNRDYRVSLRVLGRRVDNDGDDIPDSLSWISSKTPRSYDPSPNPAEMLTWEEADAMADAANNTRDAAMVQLLMDAGPRGGEFYDLTVGDLKDADHGLTLTVDGKTGERSVTLIPSVPYVNRWLSDHPGDDPDHYLWSKLEEPERVSRQLLYKSLRRLADRAGVDKDTTPTAFRKANASWLARTGANAALIGRRQGRKPGSAATLRYIEEFGEQTEQSAYAALHGREVETGEEPDRRDYVECPRCERENPLKEELCMWCGQALDPSGAERTESAEARLREALASLDPDQAEQVVKTMVLIDDTPELRAAFRLGRSD